MSGPPRNFAFGNNAAIRPLLKATEPPAYFHLLNPDTYIHPGAVTKLCQGGRMVFAESGALARRPKEPYSPYGD